MFYENPAFLILREFLCNVLHFHNIQISANFFAQITNTKNFKISVSQIANIWRKKFAGLQKF